MKAIRVHQVGGPGALQYEEVPPPEPGPRTALVRVEAAGVNFIDVYHRTGRYPLPTPFGLGMEAAGVVESIGPEVSDLSPGDRVAYAMERGGYAEYAVVPAWKLVPLPEGIDMRQGAAVMLQGMTAHYLATNTFSLHAGHTALVHAAAGGVGSLLVQIASRRGARVIATVSSAEKADRARRLGAEEVIRYEQVDFESEVKRITGGAGVDVVYDSVGQTTFLKGLNCLRPRGLMALYGAASGPVAPLDPQVLNQKGSLYLTRPSLGHYAANREELLHRAGELFSWMGAGELRVRIDRAFPLEAAADAHRYIEARKTQGKLLLIP
jgi:NADPH2:quinone reductase